MTLRSSSRFLSRTAISGAIVALTLATSVGVAGAATVTASNAASVYTSSCSGCHGTAPTFTSALGYVFKAGNNAPSTRPLFFDGTPTTPPTMSPFFVNGWTNADFNAMAAWVAGQRLQAAVLLPEFGLSDSAGTALANNAQLSLSAAAGASQQVVLTVRNPGGAGLTVSAVATGNYLTASGCAGVVAANGQCSITVTFNPTAGAVAGPVTGSVLITTNTGPVDAGVTPAVIRSEVTTLAVHGTVLVLSPSITLSTAPGSTAGSFGTASAGDAPVLQVVTVTNSGSAPVSNLQYSIGAGQFAIDTAGTTCVAGNVLSHVSGSNQCNIAVKFSPTTQGAATGGLTLNDGATLLSSLSLGATVTQPAITVTPATLPAFKTISGFAQTQAVTVTNSGDGALKLAQLTAPAGYSFTSDACSAAILSPQTQCQIGLTLPAGTAAGAVAATSLVIHEAAHVNTAVPSLSSSVTVPAGTVLASNALNLAWSDAAGAAISAPVSAGSSAVTVGTPMSLSVKLNNSTNGASISTLPANAVSIVEAGSDFQVTNTSCVNNTCTVTVTFTPSSAGAKTATLRVTDANSLTPADITLTGTGAAATAPAAASTGGGCTIGGGGDAADPLWLVMLAGAGLALRRRVLR